MSALSPNLPAGAEAKAFGEIDRAVRSAAVRALRSRANKQLQQAAVGIAAAGDQFPGVVIKSPEGALAANLAAALERIAAEIEAEAPQ